MDWLALMLTATPASATPAPSFVVTLIGSAVGSGIVTGIFSLLGAKFASDREQQKVISVNRKDLLDKASSAVYSHRESKDFHKTQEFNEIEPYISEQSRNKIATYRMLSEPQSMRDGGGHILMGRTIMLGLGQDGIDLKYQEAMESIAFDIAGLRREWKLI